MLKWTGVHDKGGIILSKNKKIVNYKKPFSLNIGVVIFVIIFIYILFNIFSYFTKTRISVYEVEQGTIAENNTYNGLAEQAWVKKNMKRYPEISTTYIDGRIHTLDAAAKQLRDVPKNSVALLGAAGGRASLCRRGA